jgi:pyruvate dehydrogenase E2 component (dihydrolipoamide acetyltransferase)
VAIAIRMPMPGQMTEECTVLQWFKAEGEVITKGDPLFEIETDKSNMEIEAFDEGTLLRIDAPEGVTVPVEAIVAWVGTPGEDLPTPETSAGAPSAEAAAPAEPAAESVAAAATGTPSHSSTRPDSVAGASSPAARPVGTPAAPTGASSARLKISPRASRVAAELGVDPLTVTGTGPGGRIVERDVRAASTGRSMSNGAASATAAVAAPPSPVNASGDSEKLSRMRQTIARRLTENSSVPTFAVTVAVDMTHLLALRAEIKQRHSPISVTDFIHGAVVQALGEHPTLNASTDGTQVWRHEHVQLGVAVSVPDGLLVPVIRDADMLSLKALQERTAETVVAARTGKLPLDLLTGSTFSVSNMGMFGVEQFTAIINPGESGILAISSVQPEVRAHAGGMALRQVMRITLTADHRLIDGELGANFVNAVKRRLEDAEAFRNQVPLS